jgi:hypothetical protein
VVRLLVDPHGGDHQGAEARLLGAVHLGHDPLGGGRDGQQGDSAVPFGVLAHEVGQPAVVRLRARHAQLRVLVAGEAEAHTEWRGRLAVDRVGVGEDDLGRHSVAVQFLEPLRGVPTAAQAFLVVLEPLARERLVADTEPRHLLAAAVAAREELVEVPVETGVQIGPVLLGGQPGVAVGGDDQIGLCRRGHLAAPRSGPDLSPE